jgi:hypothetical protein
MNSVGIAGFLTMLSTAIAVYGQSGVPVEEPFNVGIYKASHNSYDRNESLAEQIYAYNVWQLELDIYDFNGEFRVNHNCDPASVSTADTLDFLLDKMVQESRMRSQRFTVIYVDLKGNGLDGCLYSWGTQIKERLKSSFASALGNNLYHASDFINRDQSVWPSYQELVRRGHNWAVVIDWHGETPTNAASDDFLFYATSSNPPGVESDNTVLVNVEGGCDASPTNDAPAGRNGRWLYRLWPGSCASDCSQMDGAYWTNGVAKEYTFIASNCVNNDHTFQPPTHSSDPLFVNPAAKVRCPNGYGRCDWGTMVFPFHNLRDAIKRASPAVTVLIRGGQYQVTAPGRPLVVNQPMILQNENGPVTMQ